MIKKQAKGISAKQVIGVGVGVAALSAAAYLLFGPNGKKNRKAIKGWTVKMKGEIIEKFEEAKELTEPVYNEIIDKAREKYSKIQNIDKGELEATINEMKKHWKAIKKDSSPKKVKKATAPKKAVKKTVKR
jgi:gas vesicle protein